MSQTQRPEFCELCYREPDEMDIETVTTQDFGTQFLCAEHAASARQYDAMTPVERERDRRIADAYAAGDL